MEPSELEPAVVPTKARQWKPIIWVVLVLAMMFILFVVVVAVANDLGVDDY